MLAAFAKLAAGSIAGYALVLILTPVLTRIYSPSDLGFFSVVSAFVGILPPLLTVSYPFGQLSAPNTSDAARFAIAGLWAAAALSIAIACVGLLVGAFARVEIGVYAAFLCALVCGLLAVLSSIGINWAIRRRLESRAALATFANLGGRGVFQVALGGVLGGVKGLIAGELLGRLSAWLIIERGVARIACRIDARRRNAVLRHARRHRRYPTVITPALTLENLLVWLPAPLFAVAFTPEVGGLIALVQRFASVPLTIVNQSLASLFHRELVAWRQAHTARVKRYLFLVAGITMALAWPLSVAISHYGPALASDIFGGGQWAQSATIAAILVPVYCAQLLTLFSDRILMIADRNELKLIALSINLVMFVATLGVAVYAQWRWEFALVVFSATQCISYVIFFSYVVKGFEAQQSEPVRGEG